jgi:hypothetical protein
MSTTFTTRTGHETTRSGLRSARDIALFFAAPIIGLAYVVLMPFVGLFMLGLVAARVLLAHREAVKTVGLCVATPFVGLAYILLLPVVGLVTLVAVEVRRLAATPAAA